MATQEERRRATRQRLIETAREHFATRGYEETSTAAILAQAGVSKGAMYHHYPSKQALFADVYEQVSREAIERAAAARRDSDSPLETLIQVCLAWLREAKTPEVARIILEQGPAVLGLERARAIETRYSLGGVEALLRQAQATGEIRLASPAVSARLLNAMLAEAALVSLEHQVSASADDGLAAAREAHGDVVETSVREWIRGLTDASVPG